MVNEIVESVLTISLSTSDSKPDISKATKIEDDDDDDDKVEGESTDEGFSGDEQRDSVTGGHVTKDLRTQRTADFRNVHVDEAKTHLVDTKDGEKESSI